MISTVTKSLSCQSQWTSICSHATQLPIGLQHSWPFSALGFQDPAFTKFSSCLWAASLQMFCWFFILYLSLDAEAPQNSVPSLLLLFTLSLDDFIHPTVLHSMWTLKNPGPDDSCDFHIHACNCSPDISTQVFNRHLKFIVLNSFLLNFSILSKWHHFWARCSSQTPVRHP